MINIGEEIVAAYLKWVCGCNFVEPNLKIPGIQGEIDVVGFNLEKKQIFICESAVHLETGLQYVKDKRPDNVPRLTSKFAKGIEYARAHFQDYEIRPMLWSPIVKDQSSKSKYNQMRDVREIQQFVLNRFNLTLEAIVNEDFAGRLVELREAARKQGEALTSPIMRFLQVEEKLARHLKRFERNQKK